VVNENASLVKYEPPKCDECGRKIVVLSDLCAKCAAGIELNGEKQANRPGTNPLPTWPKPPAPPNPPPAPAVDVNEQDRLDAARYRYLRDDGDGFDISVREEGDEGEEWVTGYPPDELDTAIDAAIAQAEAAKKGGV
jgi:hypothetical protein